MATPQKHARLVDRAVIALGGADWRDFLHNLISQDVESLGPDEIRFAALLNPQGRLLYDLFVIGRPEGCWLDVAAEHRPQIVQRLTLYRLRAKVPIETPDLSVGVLFAGVGGDRSEGWLVDPRLPTLGLRGYGLAAPAGAVEAAPELYETHRLALGVPGPADWGVEKTYPIEANFDLLGAIDFKKGCFVGQETTSRMKRRGTVKTRFLPVAFDGPAPAPGAEILAGDLRAGEVLSVGDGLAMASLRLDRIEGAPLSADGHALRVLRPDWFAAALG